MHESGVLHWVNVRVRANILLQSRAFGDLYTCISAVLHMLTRAFGDLYTCISAVLHMLTFALHTPSECSTVFRASVSEPSEPLSEFERPIRASVRVCEQVSE